MVNVRGLSMSPGKGRKKIFNLGKSYRFGGHVENRTSCIQSNAQFITNSIF